MSLDMGFIRQRRAFVIKAAASLCLLGFVYRVVDVDVVIGALRNLDFRIWAFTILLHLALHVTQALKWRMYLRLAGARLTFGAAARFHAAGLFASLGLPSLIGGDVLRAGLASRSTGKLEAVTVGSLVDRVSDVLAILLIVGTSLVLAPSTLQRQALSVTLLFVGGLTVGAVLAGLAFRIVFRTAFLRRIPRKAAQSALRLRRALRTMAQNPQAALLGLLLSVFFQAGIVTTAIPIGNQLGFHLDTRLWYLCYPLAKAATMLPISLGGLGVLEASFRFFVQPFADGQLAVALALVMQSIRIALGLVAGTVWFCWEMLLSMSTANTEMRVEESD